MAERVGVMVGEMDGFIDGVEDALGASVNVEVGEGVEVFVPVDVWIADLEGTMVSVDAADMAAGGNFVDKEKIGVLVGV